MVTLDEGGAGLPFLELAPCSGPAATVAELWWTQTGVWGRATGWRIVPDTNPHLIHHRLHDGRTRTMVVGARSRWVDVDPGERTFTVGVRLRPGSLPLLIGGSAWELRDRAVPIGEALGAAARAVEERLAEAETAAHARSLLVGLLEPRGCEAVDWRVRGFLAWTTRSRRRAARGVEAAARDLGVSERSLRETCRSHLGLRPKEAQRILRLHRFLTGSLTGRSHASVAAAAGYSDQSHLIRDSKALLGETPEAFRLRGRAVSSKTGRPGGA